MHGGGENLSMFPPTMTVGGQSVWPKPIIIIAFDKRLYILQIPLIDFLLVEPHIFAFLLYCLNCKICWDSVVLRC